MPAAFQSTLAMPGKYATTENAKAAFEPLVDKMTTIAGAQRPEVKYYTYKSYAEWYVAEQGNDLMEDEGKEWLSFYDGSDGSTPSQSQAMANPMSMIPWSIKYPQGPSKRSLHQRSFVRRNEEMEVMYARPMSRTYLDSRLVSAEEITSMPQAELGKLINSTFPAIDGISLRGFLYGGGAQAKPAATAMGLNPAWRTSTYHLIMNAVPGNIRHDYDVGAWKKAWPEAGAYLNEASPHAADWKQSYFGSNYARLEAIKKKYDPKNVFWCSPCVGADVFTYDDERICPNTAYPSTGPAPNTLVNMQSKTGIAVLPVSRILSRRQGNAHRLLGYTRYRQSAPPHHPSLHEERNSSQGYALISRREHGRLDYARCPGRHERHARHGCRT